MVADYISSTVCQNTQDRPRSNQSQENLSFDEFPFQHSLTYRDRDLDCILSLNNALADCVTEVHLKLSLSLFMQQAGPWHGVCGGSGVWAAKNTLVESLENNFMPCCRGLHLP